MESEDQKSYFRNAKINRGLDCIIMAIVVALLSIALPDAVEAARARSLHLLR